MTVKENDTIDSQQRETTQIFLQIGHKVTKKETSLLYISNSSDLKHNVKSQQAEEADQNDTEVDKSNYAKKVITETDFVVVKKTSVGQDSNDDEPKGGDGTTVQNLLIGIESLIDDTSLKHTGELTEDKEDAVEEDLPLVIERRAVSLHVENVPEPNESEDKDGDGYEDGKNGEQLDASKESISEAEVVVVEKTLVLPESKILVEKESTGDETKSDDSATVESLLMNIATVIDHVASKQSEETTGQHKGKAIEEEIPNVVEKRPVSFHMDCVIIEDEGDQENYGDENDTRGQEVNEISEVALEDELVVVMKTPATLESEILVQKESQEKEDNPTVQSLFVSIESVIDHPGHTQEPADQTNADAIEEDAPVIIEKTPISLHIEKMVDLSEGDQEKYGDGEDSDEGGVNGEQLNEETEPLLEDNPVVVEKTPSAFESELLVEKETPEDETKGDDTVESLLVNIESVIDHPSPDRPQGKTRKNEEDLLEEDTPVVIEKRPFSLHMEHVIVNDETEEQKSEEKRTPIAEADPVVVAKIPVVCDSEFLVEIEDHEESKGDDSATVESLLGKIESAVDDTLHEGTQQPRDNKAAALEEDAPEVIEKRPVSFHMETMTDADKTEDKFNAQAMEIGGQQVTEVNEPIFEPEVVVVEKAPVEKENNEDEQEDERATVESLFVNIEAVIDRPTSQQSLEPVREIKTKVLQEDAPIVVEKRPTSLHIEHLTVQDEAEEQGNADRGEKEATSKETIEEAELVVAEKTPAVLESDILVEKESPENVSKEDDSGTVDSLLVNIESVIDFTSLKRPQEPPDRKEDALVEDVPMVIEKRRVSLHMEHVIDDDKAEEGRDKEGSSEQKGASKEEISEAEVVVVKKTPTILESEILVENQNAEDEDDKSATVESLLVNIESAIGSLPLLDTVEPTDEGKADVLEEDSPVVIEKRPVSLHIEQVPIQDEDENQENVDEFQLDVEDAEGKQETELKHPVSEAELVAVEKAPAVLETEMLVEQEVPKDDNSDNSTVASLLVNIESVIDASLPQQKERGKEDAEGTVDEIVPPAVEKKPSETYQELLETLETCKQTPEGAAQEDDVLETDILDDEEYPEPVKDVDKANDQEEGDEPKLTEVVTTEKEISTNTVTTKQITQTIESSTEEEVAGDPTRTVKETTTEESLQFKSYKKLVHRDDGDGELLLQVLKRRLSAPEVLPEKENDGSAPLAPSESGIHDSKERFISEDTRAKDPTTKSTAVKPETVPSEPDPYKAISDEEKLIDTLKGVEVTDNAKTSEESLPVAEDKQELLDVEDEEETSKKGKKGLSDPQCKCCSLM